jgi:hypothetical protein
MAWKDSSLDHTGGEGTYGEMFWAALQAAAFVEKDRTGILAGKTLAWPNFDSMCKPILPLFGLEQAKIDDAGETAVRDQEALEDAEAAKGLASEKLYRRFAKLFVVADSEEELDAASKELTPAMKKQMLPEHVSDLRSEYRNRVDELKREAAQQAEKTEAVAAE